MSRTASKPQGPAREVVISRLRRIGHGVIAPRTKPTPPPVRHGLRAILPHVRFPRTVQLCVHCRQNAAGFWVRRKDAAVVRRPWCLSCCQEMDLGSCDVTPFAS